MKISIIIPLYNKAKFIGETIYSILNQEYSEFELIIVDDGSTDGSQEVVKNFKDSRIRFYQNESNTGTSAISNKLISLSESKYIIRIDADDIMMKNRIPIQINYMNENPDLVVSSGAVQCFGDDNAIWTWPETHDELFAGVLFRSPIIQPASIINKYNWLKGEFSYDINGPNTAEDWLLWYKIGKKSKLGNVKDILIKYRVGDQNISGKAAGNFYTGRKYMYDYIFNDLGLPSDKIDLHFLSRPFFLNTPTKKDLLEFRNWLNYLKKFNGDKLIFSKQLFDSEIEKRWKQLYYHLFKFSRSKAFEYLLINKSINISQLKYFLLNNKPK